MEKVIEYAPLIVMIAVFFIQYNVFVRPAQLTEEFKNFEKELDKKFVHREAYDIVIAEVKDDIAEIKTKIDIIYNKIMGITKE